MNRRNNGLNNVLEYHGALRHQGVSCIKNQLRYGPLQRSLSLLDFQVNEGNFKRPIPPQNNIFKEFMLQGIHLLMNFFHAVRLQCQNKV